jgi:hypothetical protein
VREDHWRFEEESFESRLNDYYLYIRVINKSSGKVIETYLICCC